MNFFLDNVIHLIIIFSSFSTVYHCPFCNLCRLGRGLGVDFFHCMKCNYCLDLKLVNHKSVVSSCSHQVQQLGVFLVAITCIQLVFRSLFFLILLSSYCLSSIFSSLHEKVLMECLNTVFLSFGSARHTLAETTFVQYVANLWEIWR